MEQNEIDVSVIVLAYNAEQYIEQCLESVLNQKTGLRVEIIFADDASQDGTYRRGDDVLQRVHESPNLSSVSLNGSENIGCYGNLYNAYSLTSGKYIAYLEGDDYWTSKTKLEDQVRYLEVHPHVAGIAGRCRFVDDQGEPMEQKYYHLNHDQRFRHSRFWTYPPFQASSFLFRRMEERRLPDLFYGTCSNDKILYQLVSLHGDIFYDSREVSAYRFHSGNVSHSTTRRKVHQEHLKINRLMLKFIGIGALWHYLRSRLVYEIIYWRGKD